MAVPRNDIGLGDLLAPYLDVVFVGINPAIYSAMRGHNFARPGNKFWPAFSKSILSAEARAALGVEMLRPEHDQMLLRYGVGFTDVVKRPTARASDLRPEELRTGVPMLLRKFSLYRPRFACFHGVTGYRSVHEILAGNAHPIELGLQRTKIGATNIFLAPNPSGANAHYSRADLVSWYDVLAKLVETLRGPGTR